MFKKLLLIIIVFLGLITFAQSETSWIKKKDKSEKIEKVEKNKSSNWIKKKEVKKNKKKLKEKIKDSKSWITKKSKEKVKDIKEKLKKHKTIAQLPKAELYFAISIDPAENEEAKYIYGYINSDIKSDNSKRFKFKNKVFYSNNDGIAFFDDNETTCQIDVLKDEVFGDLKGKAIIKCKNKEIFSADINFDNNGKFGKGYDVVFKGGLSGELEFFDTKTKTIAKLENYKIEETQLVERKLPSKKKKKILLNPNGKYYALLIGNSNYDDKGWAQLTSPVNDINKIKKVLDKSYKFEEIITIKNGTKKQIFGAFKKLSKLTTTNDYVLIYYAGHGETRAEQAYWIPKDGSSDWGSGDWININELNIFLTEIKAHHLAVMVDSCYVGGKFKGTNILDLRKDEDVNLWNNNLNDELNLRARSVLSSGSTGRVSDTVAGSNNSQFALAFINILTVAERESVPLNMINIAIQVRNAFRGNYNQKPYYYHPDTWAHGGGDFIFIPKKNYK